jgi:hypothetical protein
VAAEHDTTQTRRALYWFMSLWSLKRCIHCGIIGTIADIARYALIITHIYEQRNIETYSGKGTEYLKNLNYRQILAGYQTYHQIS